MGEKENDMDIRAANNVVHLLFLVESLLLKKVVPAVRPGVRPKRIHMVAENVRPHGVIPAGQAVKWLGLDRAACIEAIRKIVLDTASRTISPEKLQELIVEEDLACIHDLLLVVDESGLYLLWGDGRMII